MGEEKSGLRLLRRDNDGMNIGCVSVGILYRKPFPEMVRIYKYMFINEKCSVAREMLAIG